jgi:hypothetical protein
MQFAWLPDTSHLTHLKLKSWSYSQSYRGSWNRQSYRSPVLSIFSAGGRGVRRAYHLLCPWNVPGNCRCHLQAEALTTTASPPCSHPCAVTTNSAPHSGHVCPRVRTMTSQGWAHCSPVMDTCMNGIFTLAGHGCCGVARYSITEFTWMTLLCCPWEKSQSVALCTLWPLRPAHPQRGPLFLLFIILQSQRISFRSWTSQFPLLLRNVESARNTSFPTLHQPTLHLHLQKGLLSLPTVC